MNNNNQNNQLYVVEASAGSGKTFALAQRYVQLIYNSPQSAEGKFLRSILAITFTNKAAFEMKARIFEFLKKIALKEISSADLKTILSVSQENEEKASQKALVIIEELLNNYNFFQVQTIDSFINSLLAGCAFRLGLSANFRIQTGYKESLELSLDRFIDSAHTHKENQQILDRFLQQYLFIENRTSWFPKKDILNLVSTLFSQSNMLGHPYGESALGIQSVLEIKKNVLSLMKKLHETLPLGVDTRFEKSLTQFLLENTDHFDIEDISDYFLREEFPIKKNSTIKPHLVETIWHQLRMDMKALCEVESESIFDCYIDIYNKILTDFVSVSTKKDVLYLEELNNKARLLYDEQGLSVEELYYRLATKFHHYLIDEFQDTSLLQWKNLVLMIEEALSTGGTLFYVGDKKQAIYGFRGGEVRLFDAIKNRFRAFGAAEESLGINYRSQREIVEFNNQLFSEKNLQDFIDRKEEFEGKKKRKNPVFLTFEERSDLLKVFSNSKQSYLPSKKHGYVQVEIIDSENREQRDELIRERFLIVIDDLRKRFALGDIACLARDNNEVEKITNWLLSSGISADSDRTSNIRENFLVKEVVSFLGFLDSPIDNLSFSSFILGEIFERTTRIANKEIRQFIFSFRGRITKEKDLYLYKEFLERYPKVWEKFFEEFFRNVGFYPLYEVVLGFLRKFCVFENFPSEQGFLMRLLEVIKNQEAEDSDIRSFLEYFETARLEDLYVNVTDSDTVKVLTIHKSKGLEFPVTVIPFLEINPQVGRSGGQADRSYVVKVYDETLHLFYLKQKYVSFSEKLSDFYREEYIKGLLSELNTVYVALTRAAQEMYIFLPQKAGNSFNFARFLFSENNIKSGTPSTFPAVQRPPQHILKIPAVPLCDWIDFLRDEFGDVREIRNKDTVKRGELLHAVLSCIKHVPLDSQDACIAKAIHECAISREISADPLRSLDLAFLQSTVFRIIKNDRFKPFFWVPDGEIRTEVSVITADGMTRRLDRLIIRGSEVVLIDYKSQKDFSGVQQKQVKEYMEILRDLYPGRTIFGYLIYLDEMLLEQVL